MHIIQDGGLMPLYGPVPLPLYFTYVKLRLTTIVYSVNNKWWRE